MEILNGLLWVLGIYLTVTWSWDIRRSVREGQGIAQQTVNTTMLFAASIVAVVLVGLPSLNFLWMFPLSIQLGRWSLSFPLSLLSVPGRLWGKLCCLGLDRDEIEGNTRRVKRFQELRLEGMDPDEAESQLQAEEEAGTTGSSESASC